MSYQSFDELVEAITNAIVHARHISERQHINILSTFFDKKEKSLVAKTVKMTVPDLDDDNLPEMEIDVPLITLIPYNSIVLSDVEIEFEAHLSALGKGKQSKKKSLKMEVGGKGVLGAKKNNVKISIKMKGTDPPEGLVKINDNILKHIP